MAFIRSQVFCVYVSVFVVLCCVDLACRVEGDTTLRLASIGDNITLRCTRPGDLYFYYQKWYRNETLIANWEGVFINDPRFTQGVTRNGNPDSNNIYISNIRMNDSATFQCSDNNDIEIQSYDLRVISCSNCISATHSNPAKMKVMCTLDNYWTSQALSRYITLNGNMNRTAVIQGNAFSFSITVTALKRLHSGFHLQIETELRVTCMLFTQPTSSSFPMTTLPTTSLKQTAQNRLSTLSQTASRKIPVGRPTSISTTKHHSPTNKNASSDRNTSGGNITLIVAILGSVFSLIFIVIIIVQRCKKAKDRRENKDTGNASIKKEQPAVRYESVEDGSGKGPTYTTLIKGLRETSLDPRSADHADKTEHLGVCYEYVEDGSRKGPEYATSIKEWRGIYRESKSTSKVTDRSSKSDYGNSAIITQHKHISGTLQQGDQYDDVTLPGSGNDAEEIPLYEMPDEGPTRNTLKATPKAGQTPTLSTDEGVNVDALYAEIY